MRSAESNQVSYDAFLQLTVPQNLEFVESNEQKLLRWTAVQNCDNYTIRINLINEIDVNLSNLVKNGSKLSYDVTSFIDELGEYRFAIKSKIPLLL